MNADKARQLLVDYLNGHLTDDERKEIEELLASDHELQLEMETIRRELHLLRSSADDLFEDARLSGINESVMKRIRERKNRGLATLSPAWRSYMRAAAAVVAIVICLVLFFILRPEVGPEGGHQNIADESFSGPTSGEQTETPQTVRMSIATSNPKVRIYWTLSRDFQPLSRSVNQ
jgi:anti-sigma-K factor RskA